MSKRPHVKLTYMSLPLSALIADPESPRKGFYPDTDDRELLESITEYGIESPLLVCPEGDRYLIIDGYLRYACARKLSMSEVPCIVRPVENHAEVQVIRFHLHNTFKPMTKADKARQLRRIAKLREIEATATI